MPSSIFITLLGLLPALLFLWTFKRKRNNMPPGPPALPILGNALQMPNERQWLPFTVWAREFGEVVYLNVLGTSIVILSSQKVISELLDKRGSIYSDRPRLVMAGEMMGYEKSVPLAVYGHHHRECRRLLLSVLAARKADLLQTLEEQKTAVFLKWLLKTPDDFFVHIRRNVASIVFRLSHGYDVAEDGPDYLIDLADQATTDFSIATAPGAFLVDVIPALKWIPPWFPGAGWKQKAMSYRQTAIRLLNEPFDKIRSQVSTGTAVPSFTESLISKNPHPSPEEDDIQRWASTAFYSAGADTTVSAIKSFFLAMAVYPDAQKKAQDELDRVVGSSRLPSFADRDHLPYLEALIKEVLRWNPVAPLALPHRLTQDDVYNGYFLPEGSIVFANSWGMMHDPATYPSPEEFKPERYFDTADGLNPDPRLFAFGYGRRICPGEAMADATLYITAAMTLSTFNISKPVSADGKALTKDPSLDYSPGMISHPPQFKCSIDIRTPEVRQLILAKE